MYITNIQKIKYHWYEINTSGLDFWSMLQHPIT